MGCSSGWEHCSDEGDGHAGHESERDGWRAEGVVDVRQGEFVDPANDDGVEHVPAAGAE